VPEQVESILLTILFTQLHTVKFPRWRNFRAVGEKQVRPVVDFIATNSAGGGHVFRQGRLFSGQLHFATPAVDVIAYCLILA